MSSASTVVRKKYPVHADPARLEDARARIRAELRGEVTDRRPLVFQAAGCTESATRDVMALDDERALDVQVARMNHYLKEFPEGDYLPSFGMTDLGQAIVPSLFGSEVIVEEKQPPYTGGRLVKDLETDLDKLPERVDPDADGWGPRLRDRVRRFIEATDGKVPVQVADHQSPYGVATKLVGNEDLMIAMYTDPELVHELMDRATNAISDLIHAMQRWAGAPDLIAINAGLPFPGNGLIIWDDYISVISPDLHAQFCRPYNMRLYEEFGFGHLHTCGPYFPHFLDSLVGHEGILSVDICSYMRGTSRTRDDLLELRRRTREADITLRGNFGTLTAFDTIGIGKGVPADRDFVRQMADGRLILTATGTPEQGREYVKWLEG